MKKVLYVILALACIYLVLCVAGPSVIKVERSATINASADAIKALTTDYSKWARWSPWSEKDPNMKITIEGEAGKAGHKYMWDGNKDVGKGSMTLVSVSADSIVEQLDFSGKGISDVVFVFKPDGAGTNVNWVMNMKIGFFGRGMMMFMKGKMDEMLGNDFAKGLEKLKGVAEAAAAVPKNYNGYEVKELSWEERTFCGTKKTKMTADKLSAFFATNYPKMGGDLAKNKIEMMGAPSAIYFSWDDKTMATECAAVIGVANGTKVKGWEMYTVPASKVLHIAYYGAYDKSMNAHAGMDAYMKEKGLSQTMVFEEYANDPMVEKDTAKWLTNIYYILK